MGDAILRGFLSPSDATLILVHAVDNGALRLISYAGLDPAQAKYYSRIPLAMRTPMTEALVTGAHVRMSAEEGATAYPLGSRLAHSLRGPQPTIVIRVLRRSGIPTGTATIGFAPGPPDTGEWRDRLDQLTDTLSLWSSGVDVPTSSAPTRSEETVTPRQREILALVSEGLTNPQIAERIDVSVATVKAELSWLFTLLGAKRRADLPARAIRAGV